jgi:hypothetical protein
VVVVELLIVTDDVASSSLQDVGAVIRVGVLSDGAPRCDCRIAGADTVTTDLERLV